MLIKNYGLYWNEHDVFWGRPKNSGTLIGNRNGEKKSNPVDFRDQTGIYVLYADYKIVYVGQAGTKNQKLFKRLKCHKGDHLAGRWNKFSWFGTRQVLKTGNLRLIPKKSRGIAPKDVLNQIEAVLIHASEPPLNLQGGRWGSIEQYLQTRDKNIGPSTDEMIQEIWKKQQST